MRLDASSIGRAAIALATCVLVGGAAGAAAAMQTPPPNVDRSKSIVQDRSSMLRAMRARFGKPIVQRFAISPSLIPATGWTAVAKAPETSAAIAAIDYQRKCDAADPSTPARIDRVRGPVGPSAVVQIAGDCFGKSQGSITLVGLGPSPVRLGVQSWSQTVISAAVPGVSNARHQSVTLVVTRSTAGTINLREPASSLHRNSPTGTTVSETSAAGALAAKPEAPGHSKFVPKPAVATLPSNETAVDFWPELERRALGADAIVNRSCGFPQCINTGVAISVWGGCTPPCADHEAQAVTASGTRPDGWHWLHAGDDAWVLRHPVGWEVERVDLAYPIGTVTLGAPQTLAPGRTLLPIHWQDVHNVYNDNETGLWFFSGYELTVTMLGPKGTWPG